MTGLSRCGRQFPTWGEALKAAQARTYKSGRKHEAWPCSVGEHWHVIEAGKTPAGQARPDPFPPVIRQLLVKRDECCQRCGFTGRLEAHHRRAKASGGSSARAHTQCACNGVLLCRFCHDLIHRNPRWARSEGWIVLQSVSKPGSVGILHPKLSRYSTREAYDRWQQRGGQADEPVFPTCDGGWNDQP